MIDPDLAQRLDKLTAAIEKMAAAQSRDQQSGALGRMDNLVKAVNALTVQISKSFPQWQPAPAAANSAGVAGYVAYDPTHFYWCISSNSWVRVTGAAW